MTLRVVFTRDDLQRVRIADRPDLMWELVQSLHQAREHRPEPRYVDWHAETRHRIQGHDGAEALFGPLCTLIPAEGPFPDFLTPTTDASDIEAGCEQVACTEQSLLARDIPSVFASRPAPAWIRNLAAGDRGLLTEIAAALRGAHDLLLRPQWADIEENVRADRARRMRALSTTGVRGLLSEIPGVLGWDGTVLTVRYARERTLHLAGRGITLVPSHFCWPNPISLIDPGLPPTLVYPATSTPPAAGDDDVRHLETLLGTNRATCLLTLRKPHTTSALADHVGLSNGSASKQATCLRESGLVVSERQGNAVVHRVSELGQALLSSRLPQHT